MSIIQTPAHRRPVSSAPFGVSHRNRCSSWRGSALMRSARPPPRWCRRSASTRQTSKASTSSECGHPQQKRCQPGQTSMQSSLRSCVCILLLQALCPFFSAASKNHLAWTMCVSKRGGVEHQVVKHGGRLLTLTAVLHSRVTDFRCPMWHHLCVCVQPLLLVEHGPGLLQSSPVP